MNGCCGSVDAVVAGAGIWGCTVARRLAEAGRRVLVLEKRAAVGGNCRCETDPETGIEIHTYGSHIFHTKDETVWNFVRRFADFNGYQHRVLAHFRGKVYHLPIGRTLLREFFGKDLMPSELDELEKKAIFDAFVRGYTSKQWGVPPEKVDPSVLARLKVRNSFATEYFDDPHQGIPAEGYNKMFERMLAHENVIVETGECFTADSAAKWAQRGVKVYYSGPLDRLFDYRFGPLLWRSLRFETESLPVTDFQHNAVVNYTDVSVPYTRIHEFRHYRPESNGGLHPTIEQLNNLNGRTVIMREYPKAWEPGDEPYYPVEAPESAARLARYRDEAAKFPNLIVGGRLGAYRYFDMDQSVAAALALSA